jgi:hypothetical protein
MSGWPERAEKQRGFRMKLLARSLHEYWYRADSILPKEVYHAKKCKERAPRGVMLDVQQ